MTTSPMSDTCSMRSPRGFRAGGREGGDQALGRARPGRAGGRRPVRGGRDVHDQPGLRRAGALVTGIASPPTTIRAIVINAGNANAATGAQGLANAAPDGRGSPAALLGCRARAGPGRLDRA